MSLALLTVLALFTPDAQASAVQGCQYKGPVATVETHGKGKAAQVHVKLTVEEVVEQGHSAGEGYCAAVGSVLEWTLTNDPVALEAGIAAGDHVRILDERVFQVDRRRKWVVHTVEFVEKLPAIVAPESVPGPSPEVSPPVVAPAPTP